MLAQAVQSRQVSGGYFKGAQHLVPCLRNNIYIAGGQLAVFQGANEVPLSESLGCEIEGFMRQVSAKPFVCGCKPWRHARVVRSAGVLALGFGRDTIAVEAMHVFGNVV